MKFSKNFHNCIVLKPTHIQEFFCNFKIERDISISLHKKWSWTPCSHFIRSTHRMNVQNKSRIFTSISIICIRNVVWNSWHLKYCKNILRDFATRPSKIIKIFEKERPRNRIQAKGQHCIIEQVFFLNLNMNLSLKHLSLNLSPDELFNVGENLNRQVSTFYYELWTEPNC